MQIKLWSNNLLCLETICFFQFYANIAKTNINRVEIKTSWKHIFCVKFCCILSGVTTNDGVSVRQNYHLQHESLSWRHRQQWSPEYCEIKKQKIIFQVRKTQHCCNKHWILWTRKWSEWDQIFSAMYYL